MTQFNTYMRTLRVVLCFRPLRADSLRSTKLNWAQGFFWIISIVHNYASSNRDHYFFGAKNRPWAPNWRRSICRVQSCRLFRRRRRDEHVRIIRGPNSRRNRKKSAGCFLSNETWWVTGLKRRGGGSNQSVIGVVSRYGDKVRTYGVQGYKKVTWIYVVSACIMCTIIST